MNMPWSKLQGPARWLVIFIAILLVASGLCGLQLLVANHGQGNAGALIPVFIILGCVELGAIVVSAAGAIVALVVWIFFRIAGSSRDGNGEQRD